MAQLKGTSTILPWLTDDETKLAALMHISESGKITIYGKIEEKFAREISKACTDQKEDADISHVECDRDDLLN